MEYQKERLLHSEYPYVRYNSERIFNSRYNDELMNQMKNDPRIVSLIDELRDWPGPRISSHKSANQFFHKLVFLADIGITIETN